MNYLLIDAIILAIPLLLTFEKRIGYFKKLPAVGFAIATTGLTYIIWDAIVTERGHWAFADEYISGIKIIGLPIEEILFFIVVPYSCLFIYEAIGIFLKNRKLPELKPLYIGATILATVMILLYSKQEYTVLALASVAAFFLVAKLWFGDILKSFRFWVFLLLSYVGFLIFNYLLTSIPIVTYNSNAIWGIRITTIPLEDFLYNFSMLGFYFLAYHFYQTHIEIKNIENR